jgi:hypothetical protein
VEQGNRGDFVDRESPIVRETSRLASCFWCESLHPAERPLSVCPSCVGTYRPRSYPLGLLQMNGPYPLTDEAIDDALARTSPGNFALGYMEGTAFVVFYVGRSDSDLKECLHGWVGAPSRYERYAPSTRASCGHRQRGPLPLGTPALDRVGMDVDSSYTRFAYSTTPSADAAFEKECRNYHDFGAGGGLDNEIHPVPLPGSSARCLAHGRC